MQADSTVCPDGKRRFPLQALKQNECRFIRNPAAGLMTLAMRPSTPSVSAARAVATELTSKNTSVCRRRRDGNYLFEYCRLP